MCGSFVAGWSSWPARMWETPTRRPVRWRWRPCRRASSWGCPNASSRSAQAVTYLACTPKSNAATVAIGEARRDIREGRLLPVPVHLRDSHYAGAEQMGHGDEYQYSHNAEQGIAHQDYLGVDRIYYRPVDRGLEKELAQRLLEIRARLKG